MASNKNLLEHYVQHPKKCRKCGGMIPYEIRKNQFCSKACKNAWKIEKDIRLKTEYNKHPSICLQCGSIIGFDPIYPNKNGKRKYCSISCQTTYKNLHPTKNWAFRNKKHSEETKVLQRENAGRPGGFIMSEEEKKTKSIACKKNWRNQYTNKNYGFIRRTAFWIWELLKIIWKIIW